MTAETDLLPLPEAEYRLSPDGKPCLHDSETLADYARACVSSATEALRERMRAEDEAAEREIRHQHARAERLAEALRDAANDLDRGVSRGDVAAHMRARAALDQETTNG